MANLWLLSRSLSSTPHPTAGAVLDGILLLFKFSLQLCMIFNRAATVRFAEKQSWIN